MMTFEEALTLLHATQHAHPPGVLGPHHARLQWALHSETLKPLSVHARNAPLMWTLHQDDAAPSMPFSHPWQPDSWGHKSGALTHHTFSGRLLRHKKGALYLGLGVGILDHIPMAVYVHATDTGTSGPWWARPWNMMADGRFTPEPGSRPWPLAHTTP